MLNYIFRGSLKGTTKLPASSMDRLTRLASVSGPSLSATFVYDGDGKRVAHTINSVTTYFAGNYYEKTGTQVSKYYYAGAQRIATLAPHCVWCSAGVRQGSDLFYLIGDHLGSTSLTTNATGTVVSELRYTAWGEVRYASGTTPTDYTYTGQFSDSYIKLLDYGSRRYDPELGRFIQPDTIVPLASQGVQAFNRYAYTNNNPVKYNDPTGHRVECGGCQLWDMIVTGIKQSIGRTYVYKNNQANNLSELMTLAFFREPKAEIVGDARNAIATDKVLLTKQGEVVNSIMGLPQYRHEDFSLEHTWDSITFGEMGNGNMLEDATHSQTWTVRAASVKAEFYASQSGDITIDYELTDVLDLKPDWWSGTRTGFSGFFYNVVTSFAEPIWHGALGASYMDTTAHWQTVIRNNKDAICR